MQASLRYREIFFGKEREETMWRNPQFVILMLAIAMIPVRLLQGAESGGSIGGVVKNPSGEPAAGALVRVKSAERGLTRTVISQERGRYNASNLPPGKYTVQSVGGGLQSNGATVEVDGNRSATLNLDLTAPAEFKKTASMIEFAAVMPEGEGKDTILSICTHCHMNGLQEILLSRKSREGWLESIAKMENRPYGFNESLRISERQREVVSDYLTKNYGPDAPPLDPGKLPKTWVKGAAVKSVITEFSVTARAFPHDVAVDSKGVGWVSENRHGFLGRFDPNAHAYTRIPLPGGKSTPSPSSVAVDLQDRVWVSDGNNNRIVQYDPKTSAFTVYPIPAGPNGERKNLNTIRFHPDGTVWATEIGANQILRLDPATKKVAEYPVPSGVLAKRNTLPYGMAIDGNKFLWFIESIAEKVGKVNPVTGEITEFEIPTKGAIPHRMAADADGNLWFGEAGGVGQLGMIDYRTGKITEYPTPTKYSGAYSIDVDRTRNLIWVDEMIADQIARFDPRTKNWVEYPVPTRYSSIRRIEVDPSRPNRVWFSGSHKDTVGYIDVIE